MVSGNYIDIVNMSNLTLRNKYMVYKNNKYPGKQNTYYLISKYVMSYFFPPLRFCCSRIIACCWR